MRKVQKYIDDFEDDSRPPIVDWVEWLMPRIIAAGCILIVFGVCAYLEAL